MNPTEYEIHNADKTASAIIVARNLEEIKWIGRNRFNYPENSPIKVFLNINGVEIKNDEMLKDFSASLPGILKIQLVPSKDRITSAENDGAKGGNDCPSYSKAGVAFASVLAGVGLGPTGALALVRAGMGIGINALGKQLWKKTDAEDKESQDK